MGPDNRNLGNNGEVTDYFLEIINDCAVFNELEAEDKLINLELLLKERGTDREVVKKLEDVKELVSKLSFYSTHCKEHEKYFHKLRSSLAEIYNLSIDGHYKIA